jgi:hypothetical protein
VSDTLAQTFISVIKEHENYSEGNCVDENSISANQLRESILCYTFIQIGLYEVSYKRKHRLALVTAAMFSNS